MRTVQLMRRAEMKGREGAGGWTDAFGLKGRRKLGKGLKWRRGQRVW